MKRLLCTMVAASMLILGAPAVKAESIEEPVAEYIEQWGYNVEGILTQWTDERGRTGSFGNNNSNMQHGYQLNAAGTDTTSTRVNESGTTLTYDRLGGPGGASGEQTGYTSLRWGSGRYDSGYSSVGIRGVSGTLLTDNPESNTQSPGAYLWHKNNSIAGDVSTLVSGTVLLTLTLDALVDGSPVHTLPTFATEIDFFFIETTNTGDYQNDIFVVLDPFEPATETFPFNGVEYTFSFGASFNEITGEYARIARSELKLPDDTPIYGWVTQEGAFTSIPTYLTMHYKTLPPPNPPGTTPTPEPGTLLLMGIGLAGLGVIARRRRQ